MLRARLGGTPILLRKLASALKKSAPSSSFRRSGGTLPKYASCTTEPRTPASPRRYGTTTVVLGEALNIPSIQIESSPFDFVQATLPVLRMVFVVEKATAF